MKLLVVQPYLTGLGGAERFVLNVARHYRATVACVKYEKDRTFKEFEEVNVVQENRHLNNHSLGLYYWNLKVKQDYDLIIANLAPSDLTRHNNAPVLYYSHDPKKGLLEPLLMDWALSFRISYFISNAGYRLLLSRVAGKFESIATNSEYTAERLRKQLRREDINVIYPGIKITDYYDGSDGKYFLFVGRVDPKKRIEYAITAFKLFSRLNNQYKLFLALSGSSNSNYFRNIEREIKNNNNIEIVWNSDERRLKSLYAESTAVLFSSKEEPFGLVPLEGMASYKPVISVNEGGPRETIIDGKTGFLVNSPKEMAEKMQMLAENPSLRDEMCKNARKHVEKNFTWKVFFSKFDKLIRKTIKIYYNQNGRS